MMFSTSTFSKTQNFKNYNIKNNIQSEYDGVTNDFIGPAFDPPWNKILKFSNNIGQVT